MDKITLTDIQAYGYHGVYPEENEKGQEYRITLTLSLDTTKAQASDNLEDTVDYASVVDHIVSEVQNTRFKLLERLGNHLVTHLFKHFTDIQSMELNLIKPQPPHPVHVWHATTLTLERTRP